MDTACLVSSFGGKHPLFHFSMARASSWTRDQPGATAVTMLDPSHMATHMLSLFHCDGSRGFFIDALRQGEGVFFSPLLF